MDNSEPDFVLLKHFAQVVDADLAVNHLQNHGIEPCRKEDDPTTMGLHRGAKIFVTKDDLDKAAQILESYVD